MDEELDLVSSTQEYRLQTYNSEAGCELESLPVTPSSPPSLEGLPQELKDLDSRVFSIHFSVPWISGLALGFFCRSLTRITSDGAQGYKIVFEGPTPPLTQHKSPRFQGFLSISNLSLSGDPSGFSLVTCVGQPAPALSEAWIFSTLSFSPSSFPFIIQAFIPGSNLPS